MQSPKVYATIADVVTECIAPLDLSWIENGRLNAEALARDITRWDPERAGFIVQDDYLPEDGETSDAFWGRLEAHVEPLAEVQEQTVTGQDHRGVWQARIQWRPVYATGVEDTNDAGGITECLWESEAPLGIRRNWEAAGQACLVEALDERHGDRMMTFAPNRVLDPAAELEPGDYRVLEVTLDGAPAELDVISEAEFSG